LETAETGRICSGTEMKLATDFFDRQAHAKKQTRLLVLLFGLAVIASIILTYVVLATLILMLVKPAPGMARPTSFFVTMFLLLGEALVHPSRFLHWLWDAHLAGWIGLGTLFSITLGCLYKIRRLSAGGVAVAELLGGRRIVGKRSDPDERRLCLVIEEMAVASQLPVPEIYVLDRERGINAFAAGHAHDDVAIAVTCGCLKLLTRDELQGLVAHEFAHILNGDTRFNMRLMALAHGLIWPTLVGRVLIAGSTKAPEIGASIFDKNASPAFLPTAPIGILFLIVGSLSLPFVRLIKSAICREREWLADAAAVQFTRNPAGIEGAFKKIGGLLKQGRLDSPYAETASHLYFSNSTFDPWFGFMSTHPPLTKRILAIDPAFDSKFKHILSLPRPEVAEAAAYDRKYEENLLRAREKAKLLEDRD
jgi:Zn-dependent protease with chaperone function